MHGRTGWGVKALPRFFLLICILGVDANQDFIHSLTVMKNNDRITTTQGSYESTVSFVSDNGYGEQEYRVKVTYNHGESVSLLKSYKSFKTASNAAKRELARLSN